MIPFRTTTVTRRYDLYKQRLILSRSVAIPISPVPLAVPGRADSVLVRRYRPELSSHVGNVLL